MLCGCPALRAVVYAITGSLLLPSMSLYLDTIQNEFNWTGNYESTPGWGLSVWSLHVLPVYAWVLSRYSGFLPPPKNMHVRLIDGSKIELNKCGRLCVSVVSVWPCDGCTPIQGVTCFSLNDSWDRLKPPVTLSWIKWEEKMDGWLTKKEWQCSYIFHFNTLPWHLRHMRFCWGHMCVTDTDQTDTGDLEDMSTSL